MTTWHRWPTSYSPRAQGRPTLWTGGRGGASVYAMTDAREPGSRGPGTSVAPEHSTRSGTPTGSRQRGKAAGSAARHLVSDGPPSVQASGAAWRHRRQRWAARLPLPCPRCGLPVNPGDPWDLDHQVPQVLGGADDTAVPAHQHCNRAAGTHLRGALVQAGVGVALANQRGTTAPVFQDPALSGAAAVRMGSLPPSLSPPGPAVTEPDPEPPVLTPGPQDSTWDACPWLADLLDVPPNATWPRLMTPPHPSAVGSYGAEAIDWAADTWGLSLRWWQRLALVRLLEHDDQGALVWLDAIVSTARQVGKSVLLRVLAGWRMHTDRLPLPDLGIGADVSVTEGGPVVMHTGRDLNVCREIQRPVRTWARGQAVGYTVRDTNGLDEIRHPDGGRWLIRSQGSVYGYTVDLGLVDEGWDVAAVVVEEGLEPTLLERPSGQLVLFSTAHRRATSLIPVRRVSAMESWAEPDGSLLIEWSAPPDAEPEDRDAWRLASPHWTPGRERLLTKRLARIQGGVSDDPDEDDPTASFLSQFLNRWPSRRLVASHRDEPVVDQGAWALAADLQVSPPEPLPVIVAVEDFYGLGAAAAAACLLDDGRVLVWGDLFPSRADAYAWAAWWTGTRPGSVLLVGASLRTETAADHVPDVPVLAQTQTDTRRALPLLRELLDTGRLVHAGDQALTAQAATVRVQASGAGGLLPGRGAARSDLIRAAAWAAAHATLPSAPTPPAFFVY